MNAFLWIAVLAAVAAVSLAVWPRRRPERVSSIPNHDGEVYLGGEPMRPERKYALALWDNPEGRLVLDLPRDTDPDGPPSGLAQTECQECFVGILHDASDLPAAHADCDDPEAGTVGPSMGYAQSGMRIRPGPTQDARCPACNRLLVEILGEAPTAVCVGGVWGCSTCYDAGCWNPKEGA